MKIRVHNAKEASALTKEWNRSGQNAGENIEFVSHETDEPVGAAVWDNWSQTLCFHQDGVKMSSIKKILRVEEFTAQDQYPVLRITYDARWQGEDLTEDLPMVKVAPDEDQLGGWVPNEEIFTPFQKELFIAACDFCVATEHL